MGSGLGSGLGFGFGLGLGLGLGLCPPGGAAHVEAQPLRKLHLVRVRGAAWSPWGEGCGRGEAKDSD